MNAVFYYVDEHRDALGNFFAVSYRLKNKNKSKDFLLYLNLRLFVPYIESCHTTF